MAPRATNPGLLPSSSILKPSLGEQLGQCLLDVLLLGSSSLIGSEHDHAVALKGQSACTGGLPQHTLTAVANRCIAKPFRCNEGDLPSSAAFVMMQYTDSQEGMG